jgi:pyridoxine 5-phosphate synthase
VPDSPEQGTSDHGWPLVAQGSATAEAERLGPILRELATLGVRSSLFLDADLEQVEAAAALGADRIELYTEPWARAFGGTHEDAVLHGFAEAAARAQALGLGVNAGHDLNLLNLGPFLSGVPGVLEVSIGHALIADALELGLAAAVRAYLEIVRR